MKTVPQITDEFSCIDQYKIDMYILRIHVPIQRLVYSGAIQKRSYMCVWTS